jgi:ribonuclease Y
VKEKNLDDLERRLGARDKQVQIKEQELDGILKEQRDRLLQITNLSVDQAKEMLLKRIEDECRRDCGVMIQNITEQAQEEAKQKSQQIILQAIQRYAADQTADHTVSTVTIPSDDMKGRVIGREGRNIRSFEKTTGVDVIIDDTPGVVVVSCFDPVRREVARLSMEKLVQDGRIHPARIEEVVATTTREMEEELLRIGKEAVQEANVGNIAKPIVPMLGRLAFRTSYGQNVLRHSLEVAYLAQTIATSSDWTARWPAGPGCSTTSARRWTTSRKAATRRSAWSSCAASTSPRRCSTRRWRTTATSRRPRPTRRSSWPPTRSARRVPAPGVSRWSAT